MSSERIHASPQVITSLPNLVSFWDFQESGGQKRVAKGAHPYLLQEGSRPVDRIDEGIFGPYSANLERGAWFRIPRGECPALDFHGKNVKVTILAWLKWNTDSPGCQAVAGIWDESNRKRQYCLFLDLRIWESKHQVCGHVSAEGGPTPGYKYCMTSAIGQTPLSDDWHFVAFTYDGTYAKVYLDGILDEREQFNPYYYPDGLFDGGQDGADFTVGAVDRSGEIGNFYNGLLGGLAVFDRSMSAEEISLLHQKTMLVEK